MKILLVEDSRSIGLENRRVLVEKGYEVVWAEDGESALRLARADARPNSAGSAVAEDEWHGCVALFETGQGNVPDSRGGGQRPLRKNRQMLLEAGADDYLEKSVIMPDQGVNLLPMLLEDVLCRIRRKRGISLPTP